MQREIKAAKETTVPVAAPSKALDKKFQQALASMVRAMSTRFKNQTFKKLNKSTIEKFEDKKVIEFNDEKFEFKDAQVGNFANVFLTLSRRARKSILRQFSDERIENMVREILGAQNARNQEQFYSRLERAVGVNPKELAATEGLSSTVNAYMIETQVWVERLRDSILENYVANSLRGMSQGMSLDEVIEEFNVFNNKEVTRARTNARTQISTFNSLVTKTRAQNLGITQAVWVTSQDERVRPTHAARNGKVFDLNEGLPIPSDSRPLLPGVDYNCRCDYRLIIPEDD